MSARSRGIAVAALQVLVVASLGAKLFYERVTRPRGWALVQTYDPNLPIRGRYIWQQLNLPAEGFAFKVDGHSPSNTWDDRPLWAYYEVRDGKLIASSTGSPSQAGGWIHLVKAADGSVHARADDSTYFFIPDTATIPVLQRGDEMWMELTLPKKGPPRPIRMALKRDGQFTPLSF
jgi:hypothetical protein